MLSSRSHYTGQHVTVELRNGKTITGWIAGWGGSQLTISPDDAAKANGWTLKAHSFHVVSVGQVTAL